MCAGCTFHHTWEYTETTKHTSWPTLDDHVPQSSRGMSQQHTDRMSSRGMTTSMRFVMPRKPSDGPQKRGGGENPQHPHHHHPHVHDPKTPAIYSSNPREDRSTPLIDVEERTPASNEPHLFASGGAQATGWRS